MVLETNQPELETAQAGRLGNTFNPSEVIHTSNSSRLPVISGIDETLVSKATCAQQ